MSEPSWWVIVLAAGLVSGLVAWLAARAGQRWRKQALQDLLRTMDCDEKAALERRRT